MVVFNALEEIEIFIRTKITYYLAHKFGAFGYFDRSNFHHGFNYNIWIDNVEKEIERSKETFITHYKTKYKKTHKFPIWMASEIFSFGRLSQLYSGLRYRDQKGIAKLFNISHRILSSWLHVLVYARNLCAHHARLWNKELAIRPKFPSKNESWKFPDDLSYKRSFALFIIIQFFTNKIDGRIDFKNELDTTLKNRPKVANLKLMGFPENWESLVIWKSPK